MNASIFSTKAYENKRNRTLGQNKPNQSQFKPNFFKGQNELKENLATPYVFDCKEISCTYGGSRI